MGWWRHSEDVFVKRDVLHLNFEPSGPEAGRVAAGAGRAGEARAERALQRALPGYSAHRRAHLRRAALPAPATYSTDSRSLHFANYSIGPSWYYKALRALDLQIDFNHFLLSKRRVAGSV